eukprot:scaffold60059_cov42-Phaeocystis_antarctica.AAC.3
MLVSLGGGESDALVDHLRHRSARAVPPLAGEPALARDRSALEDKRAHRVSEVARQPRAKQPQMRAARSVVAEARRRSEARSLRDSTEEALGAARPGQRVALLLGQRRGRRDERGAQCSAELRGHVAGEYCICAAHALHMRCTCAAHALHRRCTGAAQALHRPGEDVGEALEEGVLGPPFNHGELTWEAETAGSDGDVGQAVACHSHASGCHMPCNQAKWARHARHPRRRELTW